MDELTRQLGGSEIGLQSQVQREPAAPYHSIIRKASGAGGVPSALPPVGCVGRRLPPGGTGSWKNFARSQTALQSSVATRHFRRAVKLKTIRTIAAQLGLAAASAVTVFFTARHVEPVFLGRQPVVQQILQSPGVDTLVDVPQDSVMDRPTFEDDRRRFAADVMATGKVTRERADELATYAVREAYKRDVPPPLVFGVMMVENDEFKSTARSSVGAVGLMQIYPRVWVKSLGKRFGRNLRNDETNIQYGVYILSALVHENSKQRTTDAALRKGLLRYNGCVRGRNTRNCHRYPDMVKLRIERFARAQCGELGYTGCVTKPMRLAIAERAERRAPRRTVSSARLERARALAD